MTVVQTQLSIRKNEVLKTQEFSSGHIIESVQKILMQVPVGMAALDGPEHIFVRNISITSGRLT